MAKPPPLAQVIDVARRATVAAGNASMAHFRRLPSVDRKADGSPVTVADREAEAACLAVIREAFPAHAVLAEESGSSGEAGPSRWIVDPLDGTKGFTRGAPFWGPLIAFEHEGEIVAGAMGLPVLNRTYWAAKGKGCFRDGARCRVSKIATWEEATLSLGGFKRLLGAPQGGAIRDLVLSSSSTRGYGDLAACALLLDGAAEAWLECGVSLWDLAAPKILVEEAGGRFTDFAGAATPSSGNAAATNGLLHDHVLKALSRGGHDRA